MDIRRDLKQADRLDRWFVCVHCFELLIFRLYTIVVRCEPKLREKGHTLTYNGELFINFDLVVQLSRWNSCNICLFILCLTLHLPWKQNQ